MPNSCCENSVLRASKRMMDKWRDIAHSEQEKDKAQKDKRIAELQTAFDNAVQCLEELLSPVGRTVREKYLLDSLDAAKDRAGKWAQKYQTAREVMDSSEKMYAVLGHGLAGVANKITNLGQQIGLAKEVLNATDQGRST